MSEPHFTPPPRVIKRLQCSVCGRAVEHTAAELLEFTQNGWPECCNEVMVLSAVTEELPALAIRLPESE